ncbi:MAG: Smr/MutS family protein [Dehalococcoidia bacterium]|nr:Smr/MutS family protein [Dehalococcoidia bacterium]
MTDSAAAPSGGDERVRLRARSLALLEFDAVRAQLAQYAANPISRELVLTLEPAYDADLVAVRQAETAEARLLLEEDGSPNLTMTRDVRPILERAALWAALTGDELHAVADAIGLVRRAKALGARVRRRVPHLHAIARAVPDLRGLERELRAKVSPSGELLDDATPYLREARAETRAAYRRALDRVERALGRAEALQEQLVTVRNERLVAPVKSEFRGRLPGIVHAVSDSGATLFVEPIEAVEATNAWRERAAAEREESERILRRLSASVGRRAADLGYALELAGRLDATLAKARYALANGASPILSGGPSRLHEGRHPLLEGSAEPVSMDFETAPSGLVVTGPNTGGKTVALKTLGLLALMHQAGLQTPCAPTTRLPVFDAVYADVGDQQSIQASVSTFSSHVANIAAILRAATERSLVLLDEAGTSTDPEEGSALAQAILAHLAERGALTVATTHHRAVAAFAEGHESYANASVELDADTLAPTYRLTRGAPGRSYAFAIARRIGLDAEVVRAAEALQDPQRRTTEELLEAMQRERETLRQRLDEAEAARREAAAAQAEMERQLAEAAAARAAVVEETRRSLQTHAREVMARLKRAEAAAAWQTSAAPPPSAGEIAAVRDEVAAVQRSLRPRNWSAPNARSPSPEFAPGDTVEVASLGIIGTLADGPDDSGRVEVRVGSARVQLAASQVRKTDALADAPPPRTTIRLADDGLGQSNIELDVRGQRVHECLEQLDAFLDRALRDSQDAVRIVHGKGTGALRHGVWRHLASHAAVAAFDYAPPERGGDGATEVRLG